MAKKIISNEMIQKALKDYTDGILTQYEIGKKYGMSDRTLRNYIEEYVPKKDRVLKRKIDNSKLTDKYFADGMTNKEVALISGIPLKTIISRRRIYEGSGFHIVCGGIDNEASDNDLWETMEKRSSRYSAKVNKEGKAKILMDFNEPIAIAFIGDTHIGNEGVDYKKMRKDAEIIRDTKGFFTLMCGDYLDNHILIQEAIINSTTSPKQQWKLYKHYHSIIGEKIIAAISGNHDYWSKKVTGLDLLENFYHGVNILYNTNSFVVNLTFPNGYSKVIKIRHKFRYNSADNPTHTVKKLLKEGMDDFDIGVIAHHHQGDIEQFFWKGKDRAAVRIGSYLTNDTFAQRVGYENGTDNMPCIMIDPVKQQIHTAWDIDRAAEQLKAIRGGK
ncbi:MAG: metallophosphoesterase [Eubacteriales bacterium]|nr:metallophosphoesterase [Eubacteriales bacterium]